MAEEWPGVDLVRLERMPSAQAGAPMRNARGQRGNFGCGCLFIIAIVVGVASFFAIAQNADFPGAELLRAAGQEVTLRLDNNGGEANEQALTMAPPKPTSEPISTNGAATGRTTEPTPTPVLERHEEENSTQAAARGSASSPTARNQVIPKSQPTPTTSPSIVSVAPGPSSPQPPTSTPAPRRNSADAQTPTPVPPPNLRHHDAKLFMLGLINAERDRAGVPPVSMGDNIAAQLHAENSLSGCFSGHWGMDGLKPYMRYSLAGGYQTNAENGSGLDYCIKASERYTALGSTESEIRDMMDGWMRSPGHRSNILDPWHKKVNIGLAWDKYNMAGYQHFEGGYVNYDRLPEIANGTLTFQGRTQNELRFSSKEEMGLQLYFDPPPHSLTRGQVSRTYCYDSGLLIAAFRYPLTGGWFWDEDEFTKTYSPCPDPYDIPAESPGPRSYDEAHRFWQQAASASNNRAPQLIEVPWVTASAWTASGTDFSVSADVSDLLTEYGTGVYTILLWGEIGGMDVPVSQYSIFYQTEPPDTYDPDRWN